VSNKEIIKLVQNECANLHKKDCIFGYPCKVLNNEECNYFDVSVRPLLNIFAEQKAKTEEKKRIKNGK
jgi:hypothetical protein